MVVDLSSIGALDGDLKVSAFLSCEMPSDSEDMSVAPSLDEVLAVSNLPVSARDVHVDVDKSHVRIEVPGRSIVSLVIRDF